MKEQTAKRREKAKDTKADKQKEKAEPQDVEMPEDEAPKEKTPKEIDSVTLEGMLLLLFTAFCLAVLYTCKYAILLCLALACYLAS